MFLALTFDVDSKNQNNKNFETKKLDFNFQDEIYFFLNQLKKPTTFFVRTDHQTIEEFGNNYVFNLIKDTTKEFEVEIGWHPHFFENFGAIQNLEYLLECLKNTWEKVDWIKKTKSIRIGACQNSNSIMKWLSTNFEIDSSAMAFCKRQDTIRNYNWERTNLNPYFPNEEDYQSKGNLPILEIPITTIWTKASYDKTKKRRVLNCNLRPKIFKDSIEKNIDELMSLKCIIACSHADELQEGYEDDLYCFGIKTYLENLKILEDLFNVQYTTLENYANWWKSSCTNIRI